MKVLGYNHKVGNYQGQDYDNYIFVFYDKDAPESARFIMDKQYTKVSAKNLEKMGYKPNDLLNKNVSISYNRFGQIQMITIYDN